MMVMQKLEEAWLNRLELVKKLDRKRWISYQEICDFDTLEHLDSSGKILTHWIIYITDRMMKVKTRDENKTLWKKALPVFSSWIFEYSKNIDIGLFEKYWNKKEGFISLDGSNNFKPRFPQKDKVSIFRTLSILNNKVYNRNIISYIAASFDRNRDYEDIVRRIVCQLYLLTYETKYAPDDTQKILTNQSKFEKYYFKWMEEKTRNKKRLWAAFRDYLKHERLKSYFLQALSDIGRKELVDIWNKFGSEFKYLNQLELPGDVWNKEPTFTKAFLAPLILKLDTESFRLEDVSQVVREICDQLNNKYNIQIYPEMFDFTFEDILREEFLEKYPYTKNRIEIND
jgi:hypothetical protein